MSGTLFKPTEIDKLDYPEVYHACMRAIKTFTAQSVNIPKVLNGLISQVHNEYLNIEILTLEAANTFDGSKKKDNILKAIESTHKIFTIYTHIYNSKGITKGALGVISNDVNLINIQLSKWRNTVDKFIKNDMIKVRSSSSLDIKI